MAIGLIKQSTKIAYFILEKKKSKTFSTLLMNSKWPTTFSYMSNPIKEKKLN